MLITKYTTMNYRSRIRNVEPHLALIRPGESFHVVHDVTNVSDERLKQIGFLNLEDGECVLPRALGSVTKRNSDGFDIPLKDQPKECRMVTFWVPGWHNTYHMATRYFMSYRREHVVGYEMELTLMYKEGKRFVVSPELIHISAESEKNKHVLNLFLELFGEFEFMNADMAAIFCEMRVRRVNWTLLPMGEYPFERLKHEGYLPNTKKIENAYRNTDNVIRQYNPTDCVIGNGGFRGYVAFLCPDRNLTVLEHFEKGNATYVFDTNWEELARKTKAEILYGNLAIARIIHTDSWEAEIRELFNTHHPNA